MGSVSSDSRTAALERPAGEDQARAGRTTPALGYRPAPDGLRGQVSTAFLGPEILRLYALTGGTPRTTATATTATTRTMTEERDAT